MAAASILVLCLGSRRDTFQRNRHSQMAARVIANQTRLRKVSIDTLTTTREARPGNRPPSCDRYPLVSGAVYNDAHPAANLRFSQGHLCGRFGGDSLRAKVLPSF